MADANFITKKLSNSDRLNEASLLLYRAIAVNDLIYEAACNDHTSISEKTLVGATDALCYWLRDAKDLIDGFNYKTDKNTQSQRSAKNE